jgi:hypothetical protein
MFLHWAAALTGRLPAFLTDFFIMTPLNTLNHKPARIMESAKLKTLHDRQQRL